jgi:hypothetical protein
MMQSNDAVRAFVSRIVEGNAEELDGNDALILHALATYMKHDRDVCFPSHAELSSRAFQAPATLKRRIPVLADKGYLMVRSRKGTSDLYWLGWKFHPDLAHDDLAQNELAHGELLRMSSSK